MLSFTVPRSGWKIALWLMFVAAVVALRLVGNSLLPEGDDASQLRCSTVAGAPSNWSCGP